MRALELNDVQLQLAAADGAGEVRLLASEPGVACHADGQWVFGAAALAKSRLLPLQSCSRHWHDLSSVPLGRAPQPTRSTADLAFQQLQALLGAHADEDARLLLAVPAGLSRAQLGLLLGVAAEAGAQEIGLVDAGLAACALAPVPEHTAHLELYRHQAVLTHIEQTAEGARRGRCAQDLNAGLQRVEQLWIEALAAAFVRATRFDPLHQAASEQQLLDGLPGWLAALESAETTTATLQLEAAAPSVELQRGALVTAAEPVYADLLRMVQSARPAGQALDLRVGAQAARLPGLLERLRSLNACTVSALPPAAAALGALRHATHIFRGADTVLVCQLPLDNAAPDAAEVARVPSGPRATHVLYAGRAWRLNGRPLAIGTEPAEGGRRLQLPAGVPGVSRQHCRLSVRAGAALIEDQSTYGSFINEERVHGQAYLQRGDRLRLGTPGVSLELIELADEAES